jgi:hypothetical protein
MSTTIYTMIFTQSFKNKFTDRKLLPLQTEEAKTSGVSGGAAVTPSLQERASQRVERYVGSGDTEDVDAMTAAGDGDRLAN